MQNDSIYLNIPRKADYISLVRLTTSAIAHNLRFSIDDIEDIKVCVAESCVNVLNLSDVDQITITFDVSEDKVTIKVADVIENIPEGTNKAKEGELGLLIIKSLMDEVEFSDTGIEMIKYIE